MDTLTLKSIQIQGNHGLYDAERENGNHFELDVHFMGDFRRAGIKDSLPLTVNYELVDRIAQEVMEGPSRHLIESLCYDIGSRLFEQLPGGVHSMEVALRKISPPLELPTAYAEIRMAWPQS